MKATYTKLRDGTWGVRIIASGVTLASIAGNPGMVVKVSKRDGTENIERVAGVVWRGTDAMICRIAPRSAVRPMSDYDRLERSLRAGKYGYAASLDAD